MNTFIASCVAVVASIALSVSPAAAQSQADAIRIMREVAAQCPRAYRNAHADHNTHPERLDFIILAAQKLKAFDPRFGMNGKRGRESDPSADAIAYGSGTNVRVIDVIGAAGAHGNNLDAIGWNDVTGAGGAIGIYVDPDRHQPLVPCNGASPSPTPTPTPTPAPSPVSLQPILDRLAALEQALTTKVDAVAALALEARTAAQAVQADAESARINASDIRHVELPKVLEALKGTALTVPCMTGSVYGRRVRFCPETP